VEKPGVIHAASRDIIAAGVGHRARARHTDTPTADHDPAPSRPPTTTDEPRRTAGGRWELSSALGTAEQSCQIAASTYTSKR